MERLCRRGAPPQEAEEAVQDAVFTAFRRGLWPMLQTPDRWVELVAWRRWLKSRRAGQGTEVLVPDVTEAVAVGMLDLDLDVCEEREFWCELLMQLPDGQRDALVLSIGGLTVAEIAEELAKPPRVISDLLYDARNQLNPNRDRQVPRQRRPHPGTAANTEDDR